MINFIFHVERILFIYFLINAMFIIYTYLPFNIMLTLILVILSISHVIFRVLSDFCHGIKHGCFNLTCSAGKFHKLGFGRVKRIMILIMIDYTSPQNWIEF